MLARAGVITEKTRVVDGLRNPDICRFSGNKTRVSFARERVRERPHAALPHADKEKCPEIRNPPRELFHRRGERPSLIFFFRKFFLLSFSRLSSARFTQPLDGMEQQARDRRERHIYFFMKRWELESSFGFCGCICWLLSDFNDFFSYAIFNICSCLLIYSKSEKSKIVRLINKGIS